MSDHLRLDDAAIEGLPSPAPLMMPWDSVHTLLFSLRFRTDLDLAAVLGNLLVDLSSISTEWQCDIELALEPDGDACETGHWLQVRVIGDLWCADLTPWPDRFGGVVPVWLQDQLLADGWVLTGEGGDPPPDLAGDLPVADADTDEPVMRGLRLVGARGEVDSRDWASALVRAVHAVTGSESKAWFVMTEAIPHNGGRLDALTDHSAPYGTWHVDLTVVLDADVWTRAVWPSGSEVAFIACQLGLHHYHEPPCFPEALADDEDPIE